MQVIRLIVEQTSHIIRCQNGVSEYAHDLNNRPVDIETAFDNGDEAVCDDGDMNLNSDGILVVTPEPFDSEMLLNPFEEQLDLPAVTVKKCDVLCIKVKVVCVVYEGTPKVIGIIDNSSDCRGIVALVPLSRESDCLVKKDIVRAVKRQIPINDFEFRLPFLPDDKKRSEKIDCEESGKIEVTPVEHIAGVGLIFNPVHGLAVMDVCIGDAVKNRYLSDDVDLRVDLDSGFCAPEFCPSEHRHAQVDGRGVNSIEFSMKLEILDDSPSLCNGNHEKGELLKDSRVSDPVGIGDGTSGNNICAETKMESLVPVGSDDVDKFPEAAASGKLPEHEQEKVIPVREFPAICTVVILVKYPPELSLRKETDNLGENIAA